MSVGEWFSIQQINIAPVITQFIKSYYFSSTVDTSDNNNIYYSNVLQFHLTNDDELDALYNVAKNTRNSWYNYIELETIIIAEDNDDQSIISQIDPDLNILYNVISREIILSHKFTLFIYFIKIHTHNGIH